MPDIKHYIRESRHQEVDHLLDSAIKEINSEGLSVEFGNIGLRTTYAMLYNEDHSIEVVGYTFLKDLNYYKDNVGKLKALQQAIARKKMSEPQE